MAYRRWAREMGEPAGVPALLVLTETRHRRPKTRVALRLWVRLVPTGSRAAAEMVLRGSPVKVAVVVVEGTPEPSKVVEAGAERAAVVGLVVEAGKVAVEA